MKTVEVKGIVREALGKKAAKAVRREGMIPCVLYGKEGNTHFQTTFKDIKPLIYSPDFQVVNLSVDGQVVKAIVKSAQYHPVTEEVAHIDFLQLVEGHPVKVEIPIRFKGVSPGVKLGGKLQQNLRRVKIKTVPALLIDEMFVDISGLDLGQAVRVRDIETKEGIDILVAPATPVAVVEIPRALRSAEAAKAKTK